MKELSALPCDSINAEKFVPLHKKRQWNEVPSQVFVSNLSRHFGSLTQTTGWLCDPLHRRSQFDFSVLNLLAFLPEGIHQLKHSLRESYPANFDYCLLHNKEIQYQMHNIYQMIRSSRSIVMNLEHKLNVISSTNFPPITLEEIKKQQVAQQMARTGFNESRMLKTTPENLARVCDEIQCIMENSSGKGLSSILQTAMDLNERLKMVCKDYLVKTNILMDIERLQSLDDLNFYDMYSCRFECVEVPPPKKPKHTSLDRMSSGNMQEGNLSLYHEIIKKDSRFEQFGSIEEMERNLGLNKPSILRTSKQFQSLLIHMESINLSNLGENELIVHLIIPGIAENRPLVNIGDLVRFRFDSVEVIGSVSEVHTKIEKVMIFIPIPFRPSAQTQRFINSLLYPKNRDKHVKKISHYGEEFRFDVRFGLFASRAHDIFKATARTAVSQSINHLMRVIAPTPMLEHIVKKSERRPHIGISKWTHPNLNPEQKHAIFDIVRRNNGQAPYCIYGPPGMSKYNSRNDFKKM